MSADPTRDLSVPSAPDDLASPEQVAELRGKTLVRPMMLHQADAQLANVAADPHGRLRLEAPDTVAEHLRRAENLLRALDDGLDPTQSDAGRDLSTRHLQQRVERECPALAEAN